MASFVPVRRACPAMLRFAGTEAQPIFPLHSFVKSRFAVFVCTCPCCRSAALCAPLVDRRVRCAAESSRPPWCGPQPPPFSELFPWSTCAPAPRLRHAAHPLTFPGGPALQQPMARTVERGSARPQQRTLARTAKVSSPHRFLSVTFLFAQV